MPKPGFYAVRVGRIPGVYRTWDECEDQTKGFPQARYKKFCAQHDAENFVRGNPVEVETTVESSEAQTNDSTGKKREFAQIDESAYEVVYSDGACKGNGKLGSVAGIGVWWGHNDHRNLGERCPGEQTNNRAELIAILRVLEETPISQRTLMIKTDSQYSIGCLQDWYQKWTLKNWKKSSGEAVKNRGIIECIVKMRDIRKRKGQKVEYSYVKGHSGDVGNDGADYMANIGATKSPLPDRDWEALLFKLTKEADEIGFPDNSKPKPSKMQAEFKIVEHLDTRSSKLQKRETGDVKTASKPPGSPTKAKSSPPRPNAKTAMPKASISLTSPKPVKVLAQPTPVAKNSPVQPSTPKQKHKATSSKPGHEPSLPPLISPRKAEKRKAMSTSPGASAPFSTSARPGVAIFAIPPLVPLRPEDINFGDYEDCLLDDDDLAKEYEDC